MQGGVTYTYPTYGGQVVDWIPLPTTPFEFLNPEENLETAQAAFKNVPSDVGCNQSFLEYHDLGDQIEKRDNIDQGQLNWQGKTH